MKNPRRVLDRVDEAVADANVAQLERLYDEVTNLIVNGPPHLIEHEHLVDLAEYIDIAIASLGEGENSDTARRIVQDYRATMEL